MFAFTGPPLMVTPPPEEPRTNLRPLIEWRLKSPAAVIVLPLLSVRSASASVLRPFHDVVPGLIPRTMLSETLADRPKYRSLLVPRLTTALFRPAPFSATIAPSCALRLVLRSSDAPKVLTAMTASGETVMRSEPPRLAPILTVLSVVTVTL